MSKDDGTVSASFDEIDAQWRRYFTANGDLTDQGRNALTEHGGDWLLAKFMGAPEGAASDREVLNGWWAKCDMKHICPKEIIPAGW